MMAPTERSPLLSSENDDAPANETAPLLVNQRDHESDTEEHEEPPPSSSWRIWPFGKRSSAKTSGRWPWPSIIAGIILATLVVVVLMLGFVVPGAVKDYAQSATVIEPTNLSIEHIDSDGIKAKIEANFRLDASRVEDVNSRRIGRFVTGLMKKLETEVTDIQVNLPQYDNALLGSAEVPRLIVDLRDGHNTAVEFVTDVKIGDLPSIKNIINDWLEGRLSQLKVKGSTALKLKSGIFPLGTHDVVESMVFEASKIPALPKYTIDHVDFHDIPLDRHHRRAIGANVSVSISNHYPVSIDIPPLSFDILVANCDASDPYITVAEAATDVVEVKPDTNVTARAMGIISEIPDMLTRSCPQSGSSPLDQFMDHYLHGQDAEIFVRGKDIGGSDTPEWVSNILRSVIVPLELPGQSFGDAIRNFSVSDVNFKLPSAFAKPGAPDSSPEVSGTIQVLAAVPKGLNLDIGIDKIKSTADLFYDENKLGELNLKHWQDAQSTKVVIDNEDMLNVTSRVVDVPLNITDSAVFSKVVQKLVFAGQDILLDVKAAVDVKVGTVLGNVAFKGIPAKGKIPVKSLPKNTLNSLEPEVDNIRILDTSDTGVVLQARVNFTNPTPYTATIPYFNIHILHGGNILGDATVKNVNLTLGNNIGNLIEATWDPKSFGGDKGLKIGRQLLSEYVSGKNTTIQIQTHNGTIPVLPEIGEAFSKVNVTIATPRFQLPGDEESGEHLGFIRDATFHIFSSTAEFTLASPLHYNTVYLQSINATAFYNHTEPVGYIVTDQAFPATPGLSNTPRLPVEWSAGSIGYDKLKEALGGGLKLDALANVTLRIGDWVEHVLYEGHGIGAKVRL